MPCNCGGCENCLRSQGMWEPQLCEECRQPFDSDNSDAPHSERFCSLTCEQEANGPDDIDTGGYAPYEDTMPNDQLRKKFALLLADLQWERDGEFSSSQEDRAERMDALVTLTQDIATEVGVDVGQLEHDVAAAIVDRLNERNNH